MITKLFDTRDILDYRLLTAPVVKEEWVVIASNINKDLKSIY